MITIKEIKELKWDEYSGMTFLEHEEIGRTIYSSIMEFPHEFTQGKYDSYDASVTAGTITANAEIKFRFILREKWDSKGYWLEKTKYDALMDAYRATGSLPMFYTFLLNGVGYRWDLRKLKPNWVWKLATDVSAEGRYNERKVWKLVCHPMPKDGKELKW